MGKYDLDIDEKDWKLFRKRLPEWQEAYMGKLIDEYSEILKEDTNPSDRFWKLYDRIKEDRYDSGVRLSENSRSTMLMNILSLIDEKAIGPDDLEGFSEELIEQVSYRFDGEL